MLGQEGWLHTLRTDSAGTSSHHFPMPSQLQHGFRITQRIVKLKPEQNYKVKKKKKTETDVNRLSGDRTAHKS